MTDATPLSYPPDPGGVFASDVHRRVLAHLSTPDDDFGYTVQAQLARTQQDVHVPVDSPAELEEVLSELRADKLVTEHKGGVWQMTKAGFEKLTGPASKEAIAALPKGPARLDAPTPLDPTQNGNA